MNEQSNMLDALDAAPIHMASYSAGFKEGKFGHAKVAQIKNFGVAKFAAGNQHQPALQYHSHIAVIGFVQSTDEYLW